MNLEQLTAEATGEQIMSKALEACAQLVEDSAPLYHGVPAERALLEVAAIIRASIVETFGGHA